MRRVVPQVESGLMNTQPTILAPKNARTVQMYEHYAHNYALLIDPEPGDDRRAWLERLSDDVGPGARVLEIGSGTGRDADFLESRGVSVRRTDATQSFLDMQSRRGHETHHLNVVTDDLGAPGQPPYDAVVAICVLIHVDRPLLPVVLAKVRGALRRNGLFLVNVQEGDADELSATCFTSRWRPGAFEQLVRDADFAIEGTDRYVDSDGDVWRTLLCRRGQ